jgi:hypothetical protein
MAVSGHNGNNESHIGMSLSIGLSFYDQNMNEIEISDTQTPIDLVIKRDQNLQEYPYQYVNATQIKFSSLLLPNAFNLTSKNASIHIELKPLNFTIGYLMAMKLGYTPIINSSFTDLTSFKILCPSN